MTRHSLAGICPDTLKPLGLEEVRHQYARRADIARRFHANAHAVMQERESAARWWCLGFLAFLVSAVIWRLA